MENWDKGWLGCQPPLGPEGVVALDGIPGGRAFHLALVTMICNGFHPLGGGAPLECSRCRFAANCGAEVEDAVQFVASLDIPPGRRVG